MDKDSNSTKKYRIKFEQLKDSAKNKLNSWKDISDYMLPDHSMYLFVDEERDSTRSREKTSGVAERSADDLAAGMQNGMTSPARPWFGLTLSNKKLAENANIKAWLHYSSKIILHIFAKSNFYASMKSVYKELGGFGTACMLIEEDFETVIRCKVFTIGEFYLGIDSKGKPDTLYRKFKMTASQLVEKFGIENVSDTVRECYEKDKTEENFEVIHCVQPRNTRNFRKKNSENMAFESIYFEEKAPIEKFLSKSGYKNIPFVGPRWDVCGSNVYGTCPGMKALGDTKQLHVMIKDEAIAIKKQIHPPMNADSSLVGKPASVLPGGVTYTDLKEGNKGFVPAYQISIDISALEMKIDKLEKGIRKHFYNDLFLSIIESDKRMTATEVAERQKEKLSVLGPIVENLEAEMLDTIIERTFKIAIDLGLIPPAPQEVQGAELKIEYISILSQIQKMTGTTAIDQFTAFAGGLMGAFPEIKHKVDAFETLDQYGDMLGIPPKILRPDDEAMASIQQEQKAMQQAQMSEQMNQAAQSAKTLSDTPMGDQTALDAIMGGF
jgi:hypothetical protein